MCSWALVHIFWWRTSPAWGKSPLPANVRLTQPLICFQPAWALGRVASPLGFCFLAAKWEDWSKDPPESTPAPMFCDLGMSTLLWLTSQIRIYHGCAIAGHANNILAEAWNSSPERHSQGQCCKTQIPVRAGIRCPDSLSGIQISWELT